MGIKYHYKHKSEGKCKRVMFKQKIVIIHIVYSKKTENDPELLWFRIKKKALKKKILIF
jgi:hypothetical protein